MTPTLPRMLPNGFTPNLSPTAGKLLFSYVFCEFHVWPRSSSENKRKQTHDSVLPRESSGFVLSMYCMKANSLALTDSGMTMGNRTSIFAPQNLLGNCEVADSRTELFFITFLARNLTVPKASPEPLWGRGSFMMEQFSSSWCLSSGVRPPKEHADLANYQ